MGVSSGVESFSKIQRLILGVSVLVFVNVLSVLSTILDRRLFADDEPTTGERPFFTTFLKAAVCSVYLSGFLLFRGWREQCRGSGNGLSSAFLIDDEAGPPYQPLDPRISEPHYVPIKFDGDYYEIPPYTDDGIVTGFTEKWQCVNETTPAIPSHILANIAPDYRHKSASPRSPSVIPNDSSTSSHDAAASVPMATAPPKANNGSSPNLISKLKKKGRQIKKHLASGRSVRFQKWTEVRILNETYAEAAVLARMSYQASLRMQALFKQAASRLTLGQVLKVSFIFSLLWFMAHLASAEALADPQMPLVQILFSSSGLFTLILAAIFPSSNHDKFTLSKLVAVLFSIGGSVLVCFPLLESMDQFPLRSLWAIAAAFLVSTYVVYFQRQAENEDRLNIPLFLGFVGLFSMMLMWPGFFIARELNAEAIVWPSKREWVHLSVNLIACTFVSEVLWLWGCLLTSSLVATSALTLKVPLNVMANMTLKQLPGTWFIYVGSLPISLGFLSIAAFSYYDSWDPVFIALKKLVHCIFRFRCCGSSPRGKSHHSRSRTASGSSSSSSSCDSHDLKEQKESLIQHEQKCASS